MNALTAHDQILAIVGSIPPGRVMTYGSIAEHVSGAGARSVGQTLKADGHDVPWWRVVNAAGRPAPGAARTAHQHYSDEATPLTERPDGTYAVDLAGALWQPPKELSVSSGDRALSQRRRVISS